MARSLRGGGPGCSGLAARHAGQGPPPSPGRSRSAGRGGLSPPPPRRRRGRRGRGRSGAGGAALRPHGGAACPRTRRLRRDKRPRCRRPLGTAPGWGPAGGWGGGAGGKKGPGQQGGERLSPGRIAGGGGGSPVIRARRLQLVCSIIEPSRRRKTPRGTEFFQEQMSVLLLGRIPSVALPGRSGPGREIVLSFPSLIPVGM